MKFENCRKDKFEKQVHPIKVDPSKVIRGHFHLKCFLLTIVIYFCLVVLAWCRIASSSSSSSPPSPSSSSPPSPSSSSSSSPSSSSLSISSYSSSILSLPRLITPSLSSLKVQSSSLSSPASLSSFLTTPLTSPPLSSSSSSSPPISSPSSPPPISSSISSSSSPPTSTASIENPTGTDNNGTLHFHHHHHHQQQQQHFRRRHHHRHHHYLRRRRHRRGQTTSSSRLCEEVNICVPLAFLIMLYLVYLVESWHCRLRFELRNATTTRDVYRSVDDASGCRRPQVTWKASGYHYSRKTDYVIKNRGGHVSKRGCYFYYERINTFKRSVAFDYTSLPPPLPHHHHHHHHDHDHHHHQCHHHHHDQHCGGCCNDCLVCRRYDDVDSMIDGDDDDDDDDDDGDDDDGDSLKTKESFLSSDEELHHLPAKTCHDIFNCQTISSDIKTDTETKSEISPTNRNNNFNKPKPSPVECVLDRSENLIGLDEFPATRIIISKGFEFDSCHVQREYERQKMDFYEMCRQLDDFLEFEEHLELPGSDVKASYFAVRNNHHHHHQLHRYNPFRNRRNWFTTPPISSLAFWVATFLFLSWPYRLAVELNTASVDLKIRKLFTSNCSCHGNGTTPATSNKIRRGFVAVNDDRKSRRHEGGCKRPHLVHHHHHPPVSATHSPKCPTTPTRTPHKPRELTSATNPFYRRPPNFSKAESSALSPSFQIRSPQMFVKYRDGNISSEIKSQANYKTMQQSSPSFRPPVSKLAANGISHTYSKAKNNFFSDSTR